MLAVRHARIKKEIQHCGNCARTHARAFPYNEGAVPPVFADPCAVSFYDGNRTYNVVQPLRNTKQRRARRRRHRGVRRCCANLQIFRRCKPSPVTMQSCKYSALLPRGISMQTCGYLCIVRASTSRNVFTQNVVSIGLLDGICF